MNVLLLSARYPPEVLGGGEISTGLLAEGLAAAGAHVSVLCGAQADSEELQHGVRIRRLRRLLPWWEKPLSEEVSARRTATTLRRLLASAPTPDILHAHEFRSALTLALLDHPARVVTVRDYAPICGTTNNLWWDGTACDGCSWPNVLFRCHRVAEASLPRKPFRVWQYKGNLPFRTFAYGRLRHHIYTSAVLRERVASRLRLRTDAHVQVIPNPVDPSWLRDPPRSLPVSPVLCAVGRLETTKGTDVILQALGEVRKAVPDVHLHLVGGGEVPRYQQLARTLGLMETVTFHGTVPPERVRELIDDSVLVVSAHRWEEPFGRAALEAGARSRPLVASAIGGVKETTTHETALTVPPGSPLELAKALVTLLTDRERAATIGSAGREHVRTHYTISAIVAQHLAYYRMLQG